MKIRIFYQRKDFQNTLVQNEIKAQFEMVSLLKEKKLTSEFKHYLRNVSDM